MPERKEKVERFEKVRIYCKENCSFVIQDGLVPKSYLADRITPGDTYDKIKDHHLETRNPPGPDGFNGHYQYVVIYPDGRKALIEFTKNNALWYAPDIADQDDLELFLPEEK